MGREERILLLICSAQSRRLENRLPGMDCNPYLCIADKTHDLLPGMFVQAIIEIDSTAALSLPNEAIVNNGDDHFIFVEGEPNTFQQVAVRTGASELGYTEVKPLTTVTPDARIVIKGAYYLLSELTKGSGEHNH